MAFTIPCNKGYVSKVLNDFGTIKKMVFALFLRRMTTKGSRPVEYLKKRFLEIKYFMLHML